MARISARYVYVSGADVGQQGIWLHPGDVIPAWAEALITNPKVFAQDAAHAAELVQESADALDSQEPVFEANYSLHTVAELKDLLEERGLHTSGNKSDLIERLEDHDAAVG